MNNKENSKNYNKEDLVKILQESCKGLIYLSETDAEFTVFAGEKAFEVSKAEIIKQTKCSTNSFIEERDFNEFFMRLTKIQDWFSASQKQMAAKFQDLQKVLHENLTDVKIFRIGKIRIDIYLVGLDSKNNLIGVKTNSVET